MSTPFGDHAAEVLGRLGIDRVVMGIDRRVEVDLRLGDMQEAPGLGRSPRTRLLARQDVVGRGKNFRGARRRRAQRAKGLDQGQGAQSPQSGVGCGVDLDYFGPDCDRFRAPPGHARRGRCGRGRWRRGPRSNTNGRWPKTRQPNRRLAAILAADVVGYSRMMGADEAGTLAALKRHRETVFDPAGRRSTRAAWSS